MTKKVIIDQRMSIQALSMSPEAATELWYILDRFIVPQEQVIPRFTPPSDRMPGYPARVALPSGNVYDGRCWTVKETDESFIITLR